MTTKILVLGFYFKLNLGDRLFEEAFKHLFPDFEFTFTDNITLDSIKNVSAIFFGGGSLLYDKPNISDEALTLLKTKKIFYIGVGAETDIHPIHKELMQLAKLIAIRSPEQIEKVKEINNNSIIIPDIVYSLQVNQEIIKNKKSILILPTIEVVPKYFEPTWKNNSWEYFKSEFSQFLDCLCEDGYNINFLAFCQNFQMNDNWAAVEIINKMNYRRDKYILNDSFNDIKSILKFISSYDLVITQRYHGIILSEMAGVPCINIHHHDKLKNAKVNMGQSVSYYNTNKQLLIDKFKLIIDMNFNDYIPIESNMFAELQNRVSMALM